MRLNRSRVLLSGVGLLALLYLSACGFLYSYQRDFIYHPKPRDPDVPALVQRADDGIEVVVSTDGTDRDGPKAVVYFGGNGEDVSSTVHPLGQAFPDAAVYALHYRGYGGSGGTPSETALVADGLQLFDTVVRLHPRVVVVGRSLGSGVAVQVAAARGVERLVLITPYDSIAEVAAAHLGFFPVKWLIGDKYESWRYASRVRAPTTVIVAPNDRVIPAESTRRLVAAFPPGVVTSVVIADADHNNIARLPGYLAALVGPAVSAGPDDAGKQP